MDKFFKNKFAIVIFTLPEMLVFTVMVFYPILQIFYRSFFNWDGVSKAVFIGFRNYIKLSKNSIFPVSLLNGLVFAAVLVVFQIGLGTFLALSVSNKTIHANRLLRTSYFLPVVLSVTVVCQLWMSMYNTQYGLINRVFTLLHIHYQQSWLTGWHTAIYAVALTNAWQFMGYHFALIYADFKAVPEQLYEAAYIDGASHFQTHIHISLPLLGETYKLCFTMAITGGFNAFSQMLIMTNGGPGTMTYTLTFLTYRSAFINFRYGYGCASAVVLVLECLLATLLINRLIARERII